MIGTVLTMLVAGILGAVLLVVGWSALIAAIYQEKLRTDEVFYVETDDLWKIRVVRYRQPGSNGEPVLLLHGLNANHNDFTQPEGGCLTDYLAARGYDCWLLDVRGTHTSIPPDGHTSRMVSIEDFVDFDLPAVIAHIRKSTGYKTLHWVGHSLGGFLLYASVQARGTDFLASGTTLGSPTDFSGPIKAVPQTMRRLVLRHPWIMGEMLRCMIPFGRLIGGLIQRFFPVNPDNMPPNMTTRHLYPILDDPAPHVHAQLFEWADKGEITLYNGKLSLTEGYSSMKFPLFAIFGAADPFVPRDTALDFFEPIKHPEKKIMFCGKEDGFVEDYSHCDLVFSREGAKEVFEPILNWITAYPARKPSSPTIVIKS